MEFISFYIQDIYNITEVINFSKKYHKKIVIGNPNDEEYFNNLQQNGVIDFPKENKAVIFNLASYNPNALIIIGNGEEFFHYLIKLSNDESRDVFIKRYLY